MLKMSASSNAFLRQNLPDALRATHVNDALDALYDWIDLHGFAQNGLYNALGQEAQAVYDDLFDNN